MRTELPVGPRLIAFVAKLLRQVENNGYRQNVKLASQFNQRLARFCLDVRSVNYRETAGGQPLACDVVKHIESIVGGGLVVLIVGDQSSAEVGRQNFRGLEVQLRKRRFPAT
jgi:hypothetical protein